MASSTDPVAVMQNTQATWLDLPASWPDGRDVARKLTEMLDSRYSAKPTQRDLDVAKVAYAAGAAERATLAPVIAAARRVVLNAYGTNPRHTRARDGGCRDDCIPCGLAALADLLERGIGG